MIGQTILHYRIVSELGSGGMGVVYKAEDTKLGRTVALKFLPPELSRDDAARKRLSDEARAASKLQHNNICTIHEISQADDGRMFMCMDYYEGETLKERLARGPLDPGEAVRLFVQIADGLEQAHRAEIVHRDLRPANIVITNDGVAKILDFGLAEARWDRATVGSAATVEYLSPEHFSGRPLDERSDVFSLGVVFYEMLSGTHPFAGTSEEDTVTHILQASPPSLRNAGPMVAPMEPVIARMLAKKPVDRYRTVEDMVQDLAKVRAGVQIRKYIAHQHRVTMMLTGAVAVIAAVMWWYSFRK